MARAIALTRSLAHRAAHNPAETLRLLVVYGCALALIAAGRALPLIA